MMIKIPMVCPFAKQHNCRFGKGPEAYPEAQRSREGFAHPLERLDTDKDQQHGGTDQADRRSLSADIGHHCRNVYSSGMGGDGGSSESHSDGSTAIAGIICSTSAVANRADLVGLSERNGFFQIEFHDGLSFSGYRKIPVHSARRFATLVRYRLESGRIVYLVFIDVFQGADDGAEGPTDHPHKQHRSSYFHAVLSCQLQRRK